MFRLRDPYAPPSTVPGSPATARRLVLLVGIVLVAGFLGFAIENVLFGARYSKALGGAAAGIPFLPVYAAGGALIAAEIPALRDVALPLRFAAYAGSLTALEYGACRLDVAAGGHRSWRYADGIDAAGCVDVPHAILWGVLGVAVERAASLAGW